MRAAQHIGIVACSAEGAALCYRTICREAGPAMGPHDHPDVTMHSIPLARFIPLFDRAEWAAVADLLLVGARKVADAGAHFAICPDNTCHQAYGWIASQTPIPWLHIAQVVLEDATRCGFRRLGVLGTRSLMESSVYTAAAADFGIACDVPSPANRESTDAIIYEELVRGVICEGSRAKLRATIATLAERGCDAVVLACTELPLIVSLEDSPVPLLDSTRLLARSALAKALEA